MGAYYKAVINNEYSVNPDEHDNGYKLMEHSYLENNYCLSIEKLLLHSSKLLTWLCDYHKKDEVYSFEWGEFNDKFIEDIDKSYDRYLVNHTKEVFIDTKKLYELNEQWYKEANKDTFWCIHPLPILCNSETCSAGGGDYHKEDSRRSLWCNDEIEVVLSKETISNYEDVTGDCLFI